MSAVVRITDEIAPTIARKLDDIGKSAKTAGQGVSSLQSEMNKLKLNSLNVKLGISEQLARDMAAIRRAHQEKLNLMQQEARARADLDRRLTQGADTALKRIQAATAAAQRQRFVLEQQMDQQRTTRALQQIRTREAAERAALRTLEQQQRQQSRAVINGINEQIAKGRLAHAERTNWLKEEAALEKAVTDVAINQDKRKASAQKATHDQKMRDLRLQTQATLDAGRVQIQNDRVQRQLNRPQFVGGGGGRSGGGGGGGRFGGFFGIGGASSEFRGVRTAIESATIAALNFRTILYTLGVGFSLRGMFNEFRQLSDIQQKLTASFGKEKAPGMFDRLVGVSNETGSGLKENAFLLQRLRNATKDLNSGAGLGEDALLGYVKRINELGRVSGASANEMSNGILQFSQAMNAGRLQGDELRSVMENFPALFDAIAAGSGLTRTELVQAVRGTDEYGRAVQQGAKASEELLTVMGPMGKAITVVGKESRETAKFIDQNGRTFNVLKSDLNKAANGAQTFGDKVKEAGGKIVITTDQMLRGLGPASDKIVAKLKDIPLTIDQSLNVLGNNVFNLLNKLDQSTGIVSKMSEAVTILSDNVGLLSDALIVLGVVALPIVIAALAKLAVAMSFNFFGLLGAGLGVVTGYLIAFRNEIGFDANGTLVFKDAVVSLADAFQMLGSVLKNIPLTEIFDKLSLPLGAIGKTTANIYEQAAAGTRAGIGNDPRQVAVGNDVGGYFTTLEKRATQIGATMGAATAAVLSPLVGITAGLKVGGVVGTAGGVASLPIGLVADQIQATTAWNAAQEKSIELTDKLAKSTGFLTENQIKNRIERLTGEKAVQQTLRAIRIESETDVFKNKTLGESPLGLATTRQGLARTEAESKKYLRELAIEQLKQEEGINLALRERDKEMVRLQNEQRRMVEAARAQKQTQVADPFSNKLTDDQLSKERLAGQRGNALKRAEVAGEVKVITEEAQKTRTALNPIQGIFDRISTAAGAAADKFSAVANAAKRMDDTIFNIRKEIAGTVGEITGTLAGVVGAIENAIVQALNNIKNLINDIIVEVNKILTALKLPNIGQIATNIAGTGLQYGSYLREQGLAGRAAAEARVQPQQLFSDPRALVPSAGSQALGAFGQALGPMQQYQTEANQTREAIEGVNKAQTEVGQNAPQAFGQAANAMGQLGNQAQETGQLMQQFIGSTLSNLENAFVQFAQTGKIDFKSLMNSIIADLARMFFRMIIMQPIMMFFQSFLGGFGGGLFGFASGGLVGGGGGSFNSFGGGGGLNSLAPASTGGFSNFGGIGIGGSGGCGPGGCSGRGFATGGLVGDFKGFASGGMTSGPGTSTSDRLMTLTSPGEFIVNAAATKANLPVLNYINEGGAMGGGGGTAVSYAPNIVVNVQGGGSAVAGIQQGQMAGKELDAIMRKSFSEMLVRELRPGGTLNQG